MTATFGVPCLHSSHKVRKPFWIFLSVGFGFSSTTFERTGLCWIVVQTTFLLQPINVYLFI